MATATATATATTTPMMPVPPDFSRSSLTLSSIQSDFVLRLPARRPLIPCLMATAPAAALHSQCAARAPALASAGTIPFQRKSVKITHARNWPAHVSGRRSLVTADYRDRRGGGAGDFVAGFLLGGAVFGALGYILAPQISKTLEDGDNDSVKDEGVATKRPARFLEDDEGLEKTRQTLNEKIAQLNAAIDDVSAQLRTEDGNPTSNNVELESAA